MAVFTRTNGNAQTVAATGAGPWGTEALSTAVVVSTGIGKPVQCFGITANTGSWATAMGTGEATEMALRAVGLNATLLAYQTNTTLLSVMIEESAWNTTDLKANVDAALAAGSVNWVTTVTDVGFKLATS
jgi:hypothetical protein